MTTDLNYWLTVATSGFGALGSLFTLWVAWKSGAVTRAVEVKVDATHLIINSQRTAMIENAVLMQNRIESLEKRLSVLLERAKAAGQSTH